MQKLTLLVADNDPEALATAEEYLTALGYKVLTADNPEQAKKLFGEHLVHLAIFDMRLVNDNDERDRSGLKLAREVAPAIPKLILTKFPSHADVREAMKLGDGPLPPAVDFLSKLDGLDALREAINQAIGRYVRVNRDLLILFNETHGLNSFHLAGLVSPNTSSDQLHRYVEELEDLLRRLFPAEHQIKIDRLLWHRFGRAAVTVFAYTSGNVPESFIVVFGQPDRIAEELKNYRNFAPKTPGHNTAFLGQTVEMSRLAAISYGLAGLDLETIVSFGQVYQLSSERVISNILVNVFSRTLVEWHENKKISDEHVTLDEWYTARFQFGHDWQEHLHHRVLALAQQIPALGPELQVTPDRLTIKFGEQSFSYSNPEQFLSGTLLIPGPTLLMKTSGELTGDNILTDGGSRTWVSDFAAAGLAPQVWNFISLEAVIRFDLIETDKLRWIHEMEKALVAPEFTRLSVTDLEAPLRKPVKAIQIIRKCAAEVIGNQRIGYHLGLLYLAAQRLMDFNPAVQLTTHELVRLGHLVFATAMILDRLNADMERIGLSGPRALEGIRIERTSKTVWVRGTRVKVRGQSYDLLSKLYENPNKLCTRRMLVEHVFAEQYDEFNQSQVNRLNTAIRRLREKIEDDPANPHFIITEPHDGYRLVI